jgi:hypothetical protein
MKRRETNMKIKIKSIALGVVAIMILAGGLAAVNAVKPEGNGNGAPSGKHYNLNIIGVPNQKNANFDGGNGARIFVLRDQPTQFWVYGDDTTSYEVLDHDGTDKKVGTGVGDPGITFPYDESSDHWEVSIYVRLVGPTGSSIHWDTYYDYDGTTWLQVTSFDLAKNSKFSLKTNKLLIDGYQDILWELNPTNNFRILQMRIYLE